MMKSEICQDLDRDSRSFVSKEKEWMEDVSDQTKSLLLSPPAFDAVTVNYFIKKHT